MIDIFDETMKRPIFGNLKMVINPIFILIEVYVDQILVQMMTMWF